MTAQEPPLETLLAKEDHACSTGDCGHELQADCDAQLRRDYPPTLRSETQVEEAIRFAKKYPAQYRVWLQRMVEETSVEFLCQLLKDTENTNLSADWIIYLADAPFAGGRPRWPK